jgi:hypothetical protein
MTSPTVARERSHARGRDLSIATLSCGWQRFFRSAASQDVTGQGSRRGQLASARHLPPRSLAGGASPQPDRLGHLLSLPMTRTGWSCLRRGDPGGTPHISEPDVNRRSDRHLPGTFRLRGSAWERAASRAPPRRGARSAAPEVPSVAGFPLPGVAVPSPSCPQPVEEFYRRLFDSRATRIFDEASRSPRTR